MLIERQFQQRPDRVLVVDDDPAICQLVSSLLSSEGFEAVSTTDPLTAVATAIEAGVDLILLDVMMPGVDGLEVCSRLRRDPRTQYLCVILLSARARAEDRVEGLRAGADDYVTKPFDTIELVERVRSTLRRSREMRNLNPLTGLPGNEQISLHLRTRLARREDVALLHIDLDNFKAYNDHYGFLQGDDCIVLLARIVSDAIRDLDEAEAFLGHIGGDDLAVMVHADVAQAVAERIISAWDERVPGLYEKEDLERGSIIVRDRRGEARAFPLMTMSIGIASNKNRVILNDVEMADIATEMKQLAKTASGSSWAVDRRKEP